MSGVPSALHQAFAAVRMGGRVQLLGIPTAEVPIDFANEIIFKGLTLYGVMGRKDVAENLSTRCGATSATVCSIPGRSLPTWFSPGAY